MKLVPPAAYRLHLPAWPRPTAAAPYRLAGVAIAVGVPVTFWTLALAQATKAAGVAIDTPGLAVFGLIVAAWCLAGAALIMDDRR